MSSAEPSPKNPESFKIQYVGYQGPLRNKNKNTILKITYLAPLHNKAILIINQDSVLEQQGHHASIEILKYSKIYAVHSTPPYHVWSKPRCIEQWMW